MDWLKPLNEYCERLSPEFWAEPINAISNLSFIVAAVLAFQLKRRLKNTYWGFYWLAFVLLLVGIGSFLYHTHANLWSLFADLLPIYSFQISVIALYGCAIARNTNKPQLLGAASLLIAFISLTALFSFFPKALFNGSISYFSALLSLFFIGIYQAGHFSEEKYTLLAAALLFLVSLVFRSIDINACSIFSVGTHFLWHLLNGAVLYLIIKAYTGVLLHEEKLGKQGKC